ELIARGLSPDIGMLIDTSRNGWGGPKRPDGKGASVDERRIDRRLHSGNWCNQKGAGLGQRPTAEPQPGFDAYVWVKPPGESDGASKKNPDDQSTTLDPMCDPTYDGDARNGNNPTGAMPDAPPAGTFFPAQLEELIANAHPPVG
ncbi:MAG: glycoside hydrolase family 6 protein, partial [Nocardioides sp.]